MTPCFLLNRLTLTLTLTVSRFPFPQRRPVSLFVSFVRGVFGPAVVGDPALPLQCGERSLELCSDVCVSELHTDRHLFDMARIYRHDDCEAACLADSLARTCHTIATIYSDHEQMLLVSPDVPTSCLRAKICHLLPELSRCHDFFDTLRYQNCDPALIYTSFIVAIV